MSTDNKDFKAIGKYIIVKKYSDEGRKSTNTEAYEYYDMFHCICGQHYFGTRTIQYSYERGSPLKQLHPYTPFNPFMISSNNCCVYTSMKEILEEYLKDTSKGYIWQYSIYELQNNNVIYVTNLVDVYVEQLQNKNKELETMLYYQPDGTGAHEAKTHFESLCE